MCAHRLADNEYVVSAQVWEQRLPDLIEAVVCRDDCGRARSVHSAYLAAYGRTSRQTPLVTYSTSGFTNIS